MEGWTKEETRYLISLYEQYPVLYKCTHKDFLKTNVKETAFDEITAKMLEIKPDCSIKAVKKKIKTLRTQLGSEQRNIKRKRGMGADEVRTPKLWCYDQLRFLLYANDEEEGVSNIELSSLPSTSCEVENIVRAAPRRAKKTSAAGLDALVKQAEQSFSIVRDMQAKAPPTKAKLFCDFLAVELEELSTTFDDTKIAIMNLVMDAKAKEKSIKNCCSCTGPSTPYRQADFSSGAESSSVSENFSLSAIELPSANSTMQDYPVISSVEIMQPTDRNSRNILDEAMEGLFEDAENQYLLK